MKCVVKSDLGYLESHDGNGLVFYGHIIDAVVFPTREDAEAALRVIGEREATRINAKVVTAQAAGLVNA